jgi:integrase
VRDAILAARAADVDLEHDLITVRGTKSNAATRQVPVEPTFRALLALLVKEAPGGPLVNVPRADGKGGTSDLVRHDLETARLTRADLARDDERHMPFTFHGMRHTAITHWAVAGRPQHWLLAVAGHVSPEMTRRYLDLAAVVRKNFGTPHPKLPAALLARGRAGLFRVA